jgi:hypothetical protein
LVVDTSQEGFIIYILSGTFLHLASPDGLPCPVQSISMVKDPDWIKLQQLGFKDPSGKQWSLVHRPENIQTLAYDNAVSIKLSRDVQKKQMFTGAYIRSAEFENGGTYQVRYISICSEYTVNNYIYCVFLFAMFAAAIIH